MGLSNHGHSPGASEWVLLPLGSGSRRCSGAPSLAAEAFGAPGRGQGGEVVLFFFPLLHEAKTMGPGEGQL